MMLTRRRILDYVQDAFDQGPITTEEMRAAAAAKGAGPEVLIMLGELPSRTFTSPRGIWPYLPDLPVEA
ncbi:hypothetical protein ACI79P_14775 [Blastococcus sp. SYSU DS0510]